MDNTGVHFEDSMQPFGMLLPGTTTRLSSGSYVSNSHSCLSVAKGDSCDPSKSVNPSSDKLLNLTNTYPFQVVARGNFKTTVPFLTNFDFTVSVAGFRTLHSNYQLPPVKPPEAPQEPCSPVNNRNKTVCVERAKFEAVYDYERTIPSSGDYPALPSDFVGYFMNDLLATLNQREDWPLDFTNGVDVTSTQVCGKENPDSTDIHWQCNPNLANACVINCLRPAVGCFLGDTIIETDRGPVQVKDLKEYDRIHNPMTDSYFNIKRVVSGPEDKPVIEILMQDGSVIVVTENHPMVTLEGEVPANEVNVGHKLLMASGKELTVINVRIFMLPSVEKVYNVELKANKEVVEHHIFNANGFASGDLFLQESISK